MTIDMHEINLGEALRSIGPDAALFADSNLFSTPSESLYAAFDDEDEDEDVDDQDYDDEDEDEDDEDEDDDLDEDDDDDDEDEEEEDLEYEDDDDEDEDEDDEDEDYEGSRRGSPPSGVILSLKQSAPRSRHDRSSPIAPRLWGCVVSALLRQLGLQNLADQLAVGAHIAGQKPLLHHAHGGSHVLRTGLGAALGQMRERALDHGPNLLLARRPAADRPRSCRSPAAPSPPAPAARPW